MIIGIHINEYVTIMQVKQCICSKNTLTPYENLAALESKLPLNIQNVPSKSVFYFQPPRQGTDLPPFSLLNEYLKVLIEEWRGREIRQNPVNLLILINHFILIVYKRNYLRMQEVSVLEDNLHPFLNILSHIVPAELLFQKDIFLIINCMCNLNLSDLKIRNEEMLLRKY